MKYLPHETYGDYTEIVASTRWSREPLDVVMTPLGYTGTSIPFASTDRLLDGICFGGAIIC